MPYPFSQKDKFLSLSTAVLITLVVNDPLHASVNKSLHSSAPRSHISLNYSLCINPDCPGMEIRDTPDVKQIHSVSSRYVRKDKNSDLVITVPDVEKGKYKVRFFDEEDHFLFEIKQLRDPILIVEKLNFQHAGLFQYELYRGDLLVERNTFLIKKD